MMIRNATMSLRLCYRAQKLAKLFMRVGSGIVMLAAASATADTDIHRCVLDDGTVAFQEMPCVEPAVSSDDDVDSDDNDRADEAGAAADDVFDFVNPFDEPANPEAPREVALPEPVSRDRAECEKMTRDAIDAIDLEMRNNSDTELQGRDYLAELLKLTQQLRACKRL